MISNLLFSTSNLSLIFMLFSTLTTSTVFKHNYFIWCFMTFIFVLFFLSVLLLSTFPAPNTWILGLGLVFGCALFFLHSPCWIKPSYLNPSGEPAVPRSPQLSVSSLRSSSHSSPILSWCWPNPLAANGKPERRWHLPERQLRHRRWGSGLHQSVPHSAVLSIYRVPLQQVGPGPSPWTCSGQVSIRGQHPKGPKVREKKKHLRSGLLMKPFALLPLHFHKTYWRPDSPKKTFFQALPLTEKTYWYWHHLEVNNKWVPKISVSTTVCCNR